MGMYTELNLGMGIYPDEEVIKKLKFMLGESKEDVKIDHPLFKDDTDWEYMLDTDSYYFDGQTDSKLIYDPIPKQYFLNVRCNFKNYKNEIKLFLDWLCPYITTEGFLGYMWYEENDAPTLIYREFVKEIYRELDKEYSYYIHKIYYQPITKEIKEDK